MSNTVTQSSPTILKVVFNGINGAGAISIPGLKVGDTPFACTAGDAILGLFESSVSVADGLQQTGAGNYASWVFTMYFIRW